MLMISAYPEGRTQPLSGGIARVSYNPGPIIANCSYHGLRGANSQLQY